MLYMKERMERLTKKTKMIIMAVVACVVFISATGVTLYTKEINTKVAQTQQVYWGLQFPDDTQYNDAEKAELTALLTRRDELFNVLDAAGLAELQPAVDTLSSKVKDRLAADEKYRVKRAEVETINVLTGASDSEVAIFNDRKANVLQLIEDRKSDEEISESLSVLNGTNSDIQARLDAEAETARLKESRSYRLESSGGSSNHSSRRNSGSSTVEGQGDNPYIVSPKPTPEGTESKCRVRADGSTLCVGQNLW